MGPPTGLVTGRNRHRRCESAHFSLSIQAHRFPPSVPHMVNGLDPCRHSSDSFMAYPQTASSQPPRGSRMNPVHAADTWTAGAHAGPPLSVYLTISLHHLLRPAVGLLWPLLCSSFVRSATSCVPSQANSWRYSVPPFCGTGSKVRCPEPALQWPCRCHSSPAF